MTKSGRHVVDVTAGALRGSSTDDPPPAPPDVSRTQIVPKPAQLTCSSMTDACEEQERPSHDGSLSADLCRSEIISAAHRRPTNFVADENHRGSVSGPFRVRD